MRLVLYKSSSPGVVSNLTQAERPAPDQCSMCELSGTTPVPASGGTFLTCVRSDNVSFGMAQTIPSILHRLKLGE